MPSALSKLGAPPPLPMQPAPEEAFVAPGASIVRDVTLPDDGNGDPAPMTADLYFPGSPEDDAPLPLVVVLGGFGGAKELFGMYASSLALKGYAVMVVSQIRAVNVPIPILIGDLSALNVPRPHIVRQAIEWAVAEGGGEGIPALDTSRVYVAGHSAGASTAAAALTQNFELPAALTADPAPDGVPQAARLAPLSPLPEVRGAFFYGYSRVNIFSPARDFLEGVVDTGVPVLVANGVLDTINSSATIGTYERYAAPKAFVRLKGLDHYSFADVIWSVRDEVPSEVPREEQVAAVAAATHLWFSLVEAAGADGGAVKGGLELLEDPSLILGVAKYVGEFGADLSGLGSAEGPALAPMGSSGGGMVEEAS